MTLTFRRATPARAALTAEAKRELIEVLSAELVEEQRPPTLDELGAAVRDAERAEMIVSGRFQAAQRQIDDLTARASRIRAEKPKNDNEKRLQANRLAELDRLAAPLRAETAAIGPELEQARQAITEAQKTARPYFDAIKAATPGNLAELRKVVELRALEASQAAQDLERAAWEAPTLRDAQALLQRLPDAVLAAIAADRRRTAVETAAKVKTK